MIRNTLTALAIAVFGATGVMAQDLTIDFTTNLEGTTITPETSNVHFTLTASQAATLKININGTYIAQKDDATLLETDYIFTELGQYTVYGSAWDTDGKLLKEKTLKLNYTQMSEQKDYPGGVPVMGPVANADGSVTFCLGAPQKEGVIIVGSWDNYAVSNTGLMYYQDYNNQRYFWITIPDIDPTQQYLYYFMVDGQYSVGDPYARLVLDPRNDSYLSGVYPDLPKFPTGKVPSDVSLAVYQGNINDYAWTDDDFVIPSKSDLIIYELLFRDFTGTEGKAAGNGTVKRALEKLPYLKTLGVNVIELLPINEFNGNNSWGYNPNFYFAPDKAYGTPDDYKEFINACHENGIAVVLDMVFNQTDWQHPWYLLYPTSKNPFYNATAPHAYSVLNDWNQGHPLVRQQWKDVVQYWLTEYHVDGFRFDLVKGLGNNDSYANNGDAATNAFNQSRIDNMHQIQQWMQEVKPDALFINENLAGAQEENAMAAFGQLNWANINNSGCQYAMGYKSDASLNRMLATFDSRTWGSTVSYLESHDEQRLAYKQNQWGEEGVKGNLAVSMRRLGSAAAQMIMAPGSHMIWMFSELGNDENTKDNNGGNNTSPKKVLWSYYDVPDRRGLYDNYAELIAYRLNNPDLFAEKAGYSLNFAGWTLGRSFHSSVDGKELHLLINPMINEEITMTTSFQSADPDVYYIASKSYGTEPTFDVKAGKVTVPANSYVLIVNDKVDNAVMEVAPELAGSEPVAEAWYTVTGARVDKPSRGIFVRVVDYADGTRRSFKQVVR